MLLMAGAAFNFRKWIKNVVENSLLVENWRKCHTDNLWWMSSGNAIFRFIILKPVNLK